MSTVIGVATMASDKIEESNTRLHAATRHMREAMQLLAAGVKDCQEAAALFKTAGDMLISAQTSTGQEFARQSIGRSENFGELQNMLSRVLVPCDTMSGRGNQMVNETKQWTARLRSGR